MCTILVSECIIRIIQPKPGIINVTHSPVRLSIVLLFCLPAAYKWNVARWIAKCNSYPLTTKAALLSLFKESPPDRFCSITSVYYNSNGFVSLSYSWLYKCVSSVELMPGPCYSINALLITSSSVNTKSLNGQQSAVTHVSNAVFVRKLGNFSSPLSASHFFAVKYD